jgi:hypothetical protein
MQFKAIILSSLFLLIVSTGWTQTTADTLKLLDFGRNKNFTERNKFRIGSPIILTQEINYNDPNSIDEEYSKLLTITIDAKSFRSKQFFDIVRDSALIKCYLQKTSVWNWDGTKSVVSGSLQILRANTREIEVSLNVLVVKEDKDIMLYRGVRTFIREIDKKRASHSVGGSLR